MSGKAYSILVAEDDDDDFLLMEEALGEVDLNIRLIRVKDGKELMDYLLREGDYQASEALPRPGLILLDLNMPRKDGREALEEIKKHDELCKVPVVIMTVSKLQEDIISTYRLGANSYIRKPIGFKQLSRIIQVVTTYWLDIVELPPVEMQ